MRTCDKAFYVDQATAHLALASIHEKAAKKGKRNPLPVRTYPCDVCDGWHLTSKVVKGRKPPWDRVSNWVRPEGTAHLQQRSAEVVSGSRRQRRRLRSGRDSKTRRQLETGVAGASALRVETPVEADRAAR